MLRFPRALLAAVLLCFWGLAGAALAQPPVWIVRDHGSTLVLFGSVHLLPRGLDWEPDRLKAAVAKADELWFEIPLDDASSLAATRAALAKGMQPKGSTLRGQLSPAERAKLEHVASLYGVSAEGLDQLKPWLAEVTLSLAAYRQAGAVQDAGVERALSALAPPSLPRLAFETPEEQIGYLSGAPAKAQIASLVETLGELEEGRDSFARLVSAWMAGDTQAIQAEAVDPLRHDASEVYRLLVVDRNKRWVRTMLGRLKRPGVRVMVVGVGHLVGPDSVPAMLRARGLKVEGP
ncbi:MAG: TraB/GumN family protein [Caulobacteraceae bacterium]|nr:TraB/GumN family protein [Caulobacteraceae bacterium]